MIVYRLMPGSAARSASKLKPAPKEPLHYGLAAAQSHRRGDDYPTIIEPLLGAPTVSLPLSR